MRAGFEQIARGGWWSQDDAGQAGPQTAEKSSCCGGGGCCGTSSVDPEQLAAAIGYSTQELAAVPGGSNMALSCGTPTAIAALKPGETVLDLGSGGGFDCFVAGPKVGATGHVIGVDMTPDMVAKARRNTAIYRERTGIDNVEFRLGEIENLPVADSSIDVVISNCVLNLSPDKPRAWGEMARVLKPGGRIAVSDLALLRELPAAIMTDLEALVGCIAGAVTVEETRRLAEGAGFTQVTLTSKPAYIEAMLNTADPLYARLSKALPAGVGISDVVTSLDIAARKPD